MRRHLTLALVLSACAETLAPPAVCETPAALDVSVTSGSLLNPDASGVALPTEIRVLELRDPDAFENASFDEAWAPEGALAAAVVSTQSATLYPAETTTLTLAPATETRAVVALAVVRRPAGHTWRVIVPVESLPCGAHAALPLHADEYRIERAPESR